MSQRQATDRPSKRVFPWLVIWALVLSGLLSVCGCHHGTFVNRPGVTRADDARAAAAVRIEVLCISGDAMTGTFAGKMSLGSGVAVSPTQALTALHVVSCDDGGTPRIHVVLADSTKLVATVEKIDRDADVARVVLVDGMLPASTPQVAAPRVGTRVCTTTAVPDRTEICGTIVAATTALAAGGILHTGKSVKGNSGSAAYDDTGALIGVVVQRVPCPSDLEASCGGRVTSLADRLAMMP